MPAVGEPLPVTRDVETARLHDAVGQMLGRLAGSSPVALVVEDLHWADEATVGLLRALARVATRTRLVVIGTYRETDLDRRHPFANALPLLQREAEPTRIVLDGLGPEDVHTLLERLSGQEVPLDFAALLATETEGNPFFLRETLLHLVEEGRLRVENGVWVADGAGNLGIPAGVRDVIGRRLSRLSPDANRLLGAGALFEVSFPLAVAAAVTDIDEDRALDAIDEALDARVVAATDEFDRYAFTHALFRHTLVEELNPSRQVRMHRAIAEAIEKRLTGPPDPQTAATLARHYVRSAALPGAERGVPHAVIAADDAAARFARHEEVAALQTALELLEPGDERECALRRRVAEVALYAGAGVDEQLALTRQAGELVAATEGTDAACDFVAELVQAANGVDDIAACWSLAELARTWLRPDRRDRTWAFVRSAELAERDFRDPTAPGIFTDDDEYRELRAVVATLPSEDRSRFASGGPASRAEALEQLRIEPTFTAIIGAGAWREAIAFYDGMVEQGRQERLVALEAFFLAMRSRAHAVLGEFEHADADLDAALQLLPRLDPDSNATMQVLAVPMLRTIVCGGQVGLAEVDLLLGFAEQPGTFWANLVLRLAGARGLAGRGDHTRALALLEASLPGIERAAAWAPNVPLVLGYAVDVLWLLERTDHLTVVERNVRAKWLEPDLRYPETEPRWHAALLCALDGRIDEARRWFAESRRALEDEGLEPLLVAVDHDEALMELRLGPAGDAARLAECVAAARARCTHPAMAPWLARLDALEADAR
jgi:hypothetical protein